MKIQEVIKGAAVTLLSGLLFAAVASPVVYAASTDSTIKASQKSESQDSKKLTEVQTENSAVFKNTAADDVQSALTNQDGSIDYEAVKKEIAGMTADQLNQTKSQLIQAHTKQLDSLKNARTTNISADELKAELLKLNVKDAQAEIDAKKAELTKSITDSSASAEQKSKELQNLQKINDSVNGLTQKQYEDYINGMSDKDLQQLADGANKQIQAIPELKERLTQQVSELGKLSGEPLRDYLVNQVKLMEQKYLQAKEDTKSSNQAASTNSDSAFSNYFKNEVTISIGLFIGAVVGGIVMGVSALGVLVIVDALFTIFASYNIIMWAVLTIETVILLAEFVLPLFYFGLRPLLLIIGIVTFVASLLAVVYAVFYTVLLVVVGIGGSILAGLSVFPGGLVGGIIGTAAGVLGVVINKSQNTDATQTNPQYIKYSQTLDNGTSVDFSRKLDIKKGHTYTVQTQAFLQNANLLQAPYPNTLSVGLSTSATTMSNVDNSVVENVKGDFTVKDGTIGSITFDAKKDATIYLNAVAPNPTLQYVKGYLDLGANLNIWKVNVFNNSQITMNSQADTTEPATTASDSQNTVNQKLISGLDVQ